MKRIQNTDLEVEMGLGVLDEPFSMDQYTAHLDRGWELVSKGDYLGARASVESLFELDEESPEGFTLQGAVFWGEGNLEAAVQSFKSALEMEPDYVDAMVYLAEALSQDPGSAEEALDYLRQVKGVVEEEMPVEALVLEAELNWTLKRRDAMKAVLDNLDVREDLSSHLAFRVGRLYFEERDEEKAREWLERSVAGAAGATGERVVERVRITAVTGVGSEAGDGTGGEAETGGEAGKKSDGEVGAGPSARRSAAWSDGMGDAHYYLGFLADRAGRFDESLKRFLITREMDLREARVAWSSSQEHFALLLQRAVGHLLQQPEMEVLRGVTVIPLDYPPTELVLEGADPRMPIYLSSRSLVVAVDGEGEGEGEGEDHEEGGGEGEGAGEGKGRQADMEPLYMVVYQRNVERLCRGPEDVLEALMDVIRKEVETLNTASQEIQERGVVRRLGEAVKVNLLPDGDKEEGRDGGEEAEGEGEGEEKPPRKGAEV